MIYTDVIPSPLGELTLASRGEALCGLWIAGQKYFFPYREETVSSPGLDVFLKTRRWLDAYWGGERPEISFLPLAPEGSDFRKMIWSLLCEVPYGETTTYGALAAKAALSLGRAHMSAQAVGGAVGHNPISVIIPCHRVLGADGALTGYAGGIEKKAFLLSHERGTKAL